MMDCLHVVAPNDEELLNFALDEEPLSAEKEAHLEHCEVCQQRLARFEQADIALTSHLYRRQCPGGLQLSLYCADLLPADERMQVARHMVDCPLCAGEVVVTRRFMAEVEPLPPSFSPRTAVRYIVATLVRQQAQLVTRNGSDASKTGWPRQYLAESIDLSLHLSRASSGEYMLLGILTRADNAESVDAFEGAKAELYAAAYESQLGEEKAPLRSATVDDLGNIVFSTVPVGEYVLVIHLADRELVIEGVTIEPGILPTQP